MPFNGSGVWSYNYSWVLDAANGIPITASRMDAQFDDAGNNGFDNCLTRDGQGAPSANIPFGAFKVTGLAPATTVGDALVIGNQNTISSAIAFAIGRSGTNLALQVSTSTSLSVTGVLLTALAAGNGAKLVATSSAGSEDFYIDAKGSGAVRIAGTSGGGLILGGNLVAGTGNLTGIQLVSTVAIGTAPLIVTSTTQVANLNAATAGTASAVAVGGITGLGTGVATFLATPTSANLASALTDETGTGANVFANTPTLVTPVLGVATATSITFGQDALSNNTNQTSYTPVVTFGGASVGITYSVQQGYWSRVGNNVFFNVRLVLSSKGSSTGDLGITLPSTPSSATNNQFAVAVYPDQLTGVSGGICGRITGGNTVMDFVYTGTGTQTQIGDTKCTNSLFMILSGFYRV